MENTPTPDNFNKKVPILTRVVRYLTVKKNVRNRENGRKEQRNGVSQENLFFSVK